MGGRWTDDDDTHERHTDTNRLTYVLFIYSQLPYFPSLKTLPPHVPLMT